MLFLALIHFERVGCLSSRLRAMCDGWSRDRDNRSAFRCEPVLLPNAYRKDKRRSHSLIPSIALVYPHDKG